MVLSFLDGKKKKKKKKKKASSHRIIIIVSPPASEGSPRPQPQHLPLQPHRETRKTAAVADDGAQ